MKTTIPTLEKRLALSVVPVYVSALAASLRSVAGIYIHNLTAIRHRLVDQELLKLKEVPLVHFLSLRLTQGLLTGSLLLGQFHCTTTNASEFFQHDGRAFFQSSNDLLGNAVVDVFPHQSFAPTQFSQVYLCGMGLLTLQLSPQPLVSFAQSFDLATAVEPIVANNRQLFHASVNADHLPRWFNVVALFLKNDVQVGLPFDLEEVCRTSFPRKVLLEVLGDEEGKSHSACQSEDVDAVVSEVNRQTAVVISDWATSALRAGNFLSLLFHIHYARQCFGGFGSGGNGELAFQSRVSTDLFIGKMMQANPIELLVVPSGLTYEVEGSDVCFKCGLEHLVVYFQLHFSGSYLFHIPPVYRSGETDFLKQN